MVTKTIWISYDLGVGGDYEGLYAWLDNNEATECGDSLDVREYLNAMPPSTIVLQRAKICEGAVVK